jgi:hypothetical protein
VNQKTPTTIDMDFALEMATWAQEQLAVATFLQAEPWLVLDQNPEQAAKQLIDQHEFGAVGERLVLAKQWLQGGAPVIIGVLRVRRKILDAEASPPIFANTAIALDFLSVPDPAWRARGVLTMLLQTAADFAVTLHVGALQMYIQAADLPPDYQSDIESALAQQEFSQADAKLWQKALPLQLPIARVGAARTEIARPPATLIGSKTRAELQAIYLQIAALARFELAIYSRDLDAPILDQAEILDCLRQLSLQKGARIRILVQDSGRALRDGHRLLELARRMSSAFEFRSPQAEDLQYSSAFIVNDQNGHVLRDLATRFDSEGNLYDLASAQRQKRYFDEVWERSPVTSEFRRLSF